MSIQKACEKMEELLDRDMKSDRNILKLDEFAALNALLFELNIRGEYEFTVEKEKTK